jgi:hypothetical protein
VANISMSLNMKNKALVTQANAAIAKMTADTKAYIDANDFKNIQPKVGYLEEKTYPIYATYNMSYSPCNSNPSWAVSDAAGREVVYTLASDGQSTSPLKIYRAYRFNSKEEFTFENTDIRPAYLSEDLYVNGLIGLGCEWIAYSCSDGKYHLVLTNGQGYEKWASYKDITSIISGSVHNILYFAESDTIGTFVLNGLARELRLYKYSDLSLIKTIPLFDGTIDPGGRTDITSTSNRHFGNLVYNKTTKQLIMVTGYITYLTVSHVYYKVVNAFEVDNNFLSTGEGTFNPLFTNDDIAMNSGNAVYANFNDAIRGVYDDYEQVIRYINKPQDWYLETIRKVSALTPLTSKNFFSDQLSSISYTTPDACPWAKRIRPPIYAMNGNLYFNADTETYGSSHIYVDHYHTQSSNGYLDLVPGRWWRANGIEDATFQGDNVRYLQCQRINESTTKWQGVWSWGSVVRDVSFSQTTRDGITMNGLRTFGNPVVTFPALPSSDYIAISTVSYNNKRNKALGIVAKRTTDWADLILLEYDFATKAFKEYDTMPTTIKNKEAEMKERVVTFASNRIMPYSNMLIDLDSTVYTTIRFDMGGWADMFTLVIAPDKTITLIGGLGAYYGSKAIGYDEVFGYYKCTQDGGYAYEVMYHTKDVAGIEAEKTIGDFKSGSLYVTKIGPKSAVGLIAYSQKTPMLVNGKCKTIGSVGVTLYPQTDNYIFVVGKDDMFKLEARKSNILLAGESKFNTVLIAKIVTNECDPVSIVYYDI